MTKENKIKTLYEHYKNTPKKLKIICDWDEVIQPHEPYALWKSLKPGADKAPSFYSFYYPFWSGEYKIDYSPYGSKLHITKKALEKQQELKNSPAFYQQAPFLTIAEDLLKLIKEDKVERLIFLSAYDKKKFPYGDDRKEQIFKETFDGIGYYRTELDKKERRMTLPCYLELIPFDSESQGQSKAEWIKENASDFDLVIDDNPNICRSSLEIMEPSEDCLKNGGCSECDEEIKVLAPYYPAVANQHHEQVLLVKNEVSNIKKEDFSNKDYEKNQLSIKRV